MKPILYLRSKSNSFINFLKEKKETPEELLIKEPSFCESCEEMTYQPKKLHKCNGCGERNICNECYIEHKDICENCNKDLMSFYDQIKMSFGNTYKQKWIKN